jgi:hypothetical protein
MFKTAMLGVVGSPRIRECIECAELGGERCGGFGAGCFLPRAASGGRADAAAQRHALAEAGGEARVEDTPRER